MYVVLLALVGFLAWGPQVVLASFDFISFSSIEQCGPFNVTFDGGIPPAAMPLTLTVVPFNNTPISIQIPESAWNSTTSSGVYITLLPLAAGTTLIASLDDANGVSTGNVSDIIRIQGSDNTSCLGSPAIPPTHLFTLDSSVTQCEPFNVSFNSTVDPTPPSARVFVPLGPSFNLTEEPSPQTGVGSYLMNVTRGKQVAVLYQDAAGNRESSQLITVDGDTSSSSNCLEAQPETSTAGVLGGASSSNNSSSGLPRVTIIVISVTTVVIVGTLSLLAVVFVSRERQRRRLAILQDYYLRPGGPYLQDTEKAAPPTAPPRPYFPQGREQPLESRYLTGNPYPFENFISPSNRTSTMTGRSRLTITPPSVNGASVEALHSHPTTPLPAMPTPILDPPPRRRGSVNSRTIASLDIEGILEQASISPGPSQTTHAFNSLPRIQMVDVPPATSPTPSGLRSSPLSHREAQELDVPSSATPSGRFSDYSSIMQDTSVRGISTPFPTFPSTPPPSNTLSPYR
ncbi:hypothetical protein OF83DRAFT_709763 [Amylostereum chailletii]|nr:hypothetical protein OF83DRAFT_709763 [Amylostereum chailletii]